MDLNRIRGGAVIWPDRAWRPAGAYATISSTICGAQNSSVIFVGFAAEGTLARQIIDGAKTVHLFGEEIPVRARIHTINGFSAHADQAELLAWHAQTGAKRTFLVHGEEEAMRQFAAKSHRTRSRCRSCIRALSCKPAIKK